MVHEIEVHEFKADPTHTQAVVTLKFKEPSSDNHAAYEQLRSPRAIGLALARASKEGMSDPGTTNFPSVYAVDAQGQRIAAAQQEPVADWRCDVCVMRKLV